MDSSLIGYMVVSGLEEGPLVVSPESCRVWACGDGMGSKGWGWVGSRVKGGGGGEESMVIFFGGGGGA